MASSAKEFKAGRLFLFGIILPVLALAMELAGHAFSDMFFDPVPTIVHVLLIAAVPVTNAFVLKVIQEQQTKHFDKLGFCYGFVLAVTGYYSLVFLPLVPIGLSTIPAFGLGLLVLSPILAFFVIFGCRRHLQVLVTEEGTKIIPNVWKGGVLALLVLFSLGIFQNITLFLISAASQPGGKGAVQMLRDIGDRETMLKACYRDFEIKNDVRTFWMVWMNPVTVTEARKVFFRVMGASYATMEKPEFSHPPFGFLERSAEFEEESRSQEVGERRLDDLFLVESRIDGSIDADGGVSYTEWAMEFENRGYQMAEARANIVLPPNGVVSRLTLWIDGEGREAAFATRQKAKEAYQRVVSRKKDPVLVTTAGKDQVLVRCFPVPVRGTMKIRIGITAPLILPDPEQGVLRLPYFSKRNFSIGTKMRHAVSFEAKQQLASPEDHLTSREANKDRYTVEGLLNDRALSEQKTIRAVRNKMVTSMWGDNAFGGQIDEKEPYVIQSLREETVFVPKRVVVVIDGSLGMKPFASTIAAALEELPEGIEFGLLLASDEVEQYSKTLQVGSKNTYAEMATWLKNAHFKGGQDNVPALSVAWEQAAKKANSLILWIHGPIPLILQSANPLVHHWQQRYDHPWLYELQVDSGRNRLIQEFDPHAIQSVLRYGPSDEALLRLFALWQGKVKQLSLVRRSSSNLSQVLKNGYKTTSHLARLKAYDDVMRYTTLKSSNDQTKAVAVAKRYQLVTPVTGAVVLETEKQYKEAGLKPIDPNQAPGIPEPKMWMLFVIGLFVLGCFGRRKGKSG